MNGKCIELEAAARQAGSSLFSRLVVLKRAHYVTGPKKRNYLPDRKLSVCAYSVRAAAVLPSTYASGPLPA